MNQPRWQRLAEWPLTIAAVVFLVAYAWEVIGDLTGMPAKISEAVIWATWAVFAIDYVVNLVLAKHRWHWFTHHIFDLLVVALPLLRPLRLLRLVMLMTVLQRSVGNTFRGRVFVYVAGTTSLLVFIAALAELDAERNAAGATITSFGDALWWAAVTIATVGYGDYSPVTLTGRIIAAGLMAGGLALIGAVTATLASWIIERVSRTEADAQAATRGEIRALSREIAALRGELEHRRAVPDAGSDATAVPGATEADVSAAPSASEAGAARAADAEELVARGEIPSMGPAR